MSSVKPQPNQLSNTTPTSVKPPPNQQPNTTPTIVREEIASLENQITHLEKKNTNSPILLQIFRERFAFTPFKEKLQWAKFKLKLKQEELFSLLN